MAASRTPRGSSRGAVAPSSPTRTSRGSGKAMPPSRSTAARSLPKAGLRLPGAPSGSPARKITPIRGASSVTSRSTGGKSVAHKATSSVQGAMPKFRGIARAPKQPGIDLPKFLGEVGDNIGRALPSRGASGVVSNTMRGLPNGGVSGVMKGGR